VVALVCVFWVVSCGGASLCFGWWVAVGLWCSVSGMVVVELWAWLLSCEYGCVGVG